MTGDEAPDGPNTWHRQAVYAAARGLVVLLVAAVAYAAVIPYNHAVRSRLARLVPTRTGLPAYDKAKPQAGEQSDSGTGVAEVTAAAKKSPGGTGIYSIEWSPTSTSGAGIIAFLLPNRADAKTALGQIEKQQLAAGSYTSDQLKQASTFAVPGVPGSTGSVYHPTSAGGLPDLAVTAFQDGRVVAVSEIATTASSAQSDAEALTKAEFSKLKSLGTGFTLEATVNPLVPTILWGAGAVLLAALAALGPVYRRRRADKRQRAYEEEMASKVVVGRRVVATKHRR